MNWVQISCSFLFFLFSNILLRLTSTPSVLKKAIVILFIVFVLLASFSVSYTVSLQNTKNTLTMFLIGIATVSLFFALEFKQIAMVTIGITMFYWIMMITAKISFDDKMMNVFAGAVLGLILFCFSRYSYYFKSQHFVRLKQLEEKNEEIAKLHAQQGEILGFVAHDLRNPLNNIEALGNLLYNDNPNDELKLILSSTQQAKNIINDLLEVVKTDRDKIDTKLINVGVFLTSIVDKWKANTNRGIELNLTENILAYANASRLERVLDNLISNALKFSKVDESVAISLEKTGENIQITVKDNGIGIPSELIEKIFQQFSLAGRTGLLGEKSIGLGLHISKKIMEQHGGDLLVESEENRGTKFTAVFPAVVS